MVGLSAACGGADIRTFQVTFKTVRNCHPAGIFPQLCDDPSTFEGKTRISLVHVEQRGPTDFVLYEENGRALPGRIERGYYFARQREEITEPTGCRRYSERSVRFDIQRGRPKLPWREAEPATMDGSTQDRTGQSAECGQPADSKFEETFSGVELDNGTGAPWGSAP
jgi:hypothetical protein